MSNNDNNQKLKKLIQISQKLETCENLETGIQLLTEQLKKVIDVDRISIFIYSPTTNMVWSYLADGVEKLILPADKGVLGYAIKNKSIKKVNDTSKEPIFFKDVDNSTGYQTKNLLAVPLFNKDNEVLGVIEFLNKRDGKFNQKDLNIAYLFSTYLSKPLEKLLHKKS